MSAPKPSPASCCSDLTLSGVTFDVAQPAAAQGGIEPEPIEEAQLFAPMRVPQAPASAPSPPTTTPTIAARTPQLQGAQAALVWTGSWYEADVAVDPLAPERRRRDAGRQTVEAALYRYRRMGHDLRVQAAVYVPLKLALEVCALPGYDRGHVKAALLERFGNWRRRPAASSIPTSSRFGESVYLSAASSPRRRRCRASRA